MPREPHFLLSFHLIITSEGDDDGDDGDDDGGGGGGDGDDGGDDGTIYGCERYVRLSNGDYDVNDNIPEAIKFPFLSC